jgi:hypothetical protein
MRRLKNLTVAAFIVIGGIVGAGSSYATTFVGSLSDATGLDGLVVDGVTYNVTFDNGAYTTVYATTPPTFSGDEHGADDAATALALALNALQVTGINGLSLSSIPYILTPFSIDSFGTVESATDDGAPEPPPYLPWNTLSPSFTNESTSVSNLGADYTIFSAATTPLPAALPLFATGLGALGLLGWRRKRRAQAAI